MNLILLYIRLGIPMSLKGILTRFISPFLLVIKQVKHYTFYHLYHNLAKCINNGRKEEELQ